MSPGPTKGTEHVPRAIVSGCAWHPKREQGLLDPSLLHGKNKTILRILMCNEDAEAKATDSAEGTFLHLLHSHYRKTALPGALDGIIHQKSRSSRCQQIGMPNYFQFSYIRRERISHIRAVMTILCDRLAYAGRVSTLNPEIQKRKQKSHQEFILLCVLLQNFFKGSKLHEKENHVRRIYSYCIHGSDI